jgi:alpha-N-acetylglucosaminidase
VLANRGRQLRTRILEAYQDKDRDAVLHHWQRFLRALDLTEEILATDRHSLHEYANRDWHGLLSGYYKPRRVRFLNALPSTISSGVEPDFSDRHTRGDAWSRPQELHTTTPSGDPHVVASRVAAELAGDPV